MKKCSNCGNTYLDDTMYCPKDNYRLEYDNSIKPNINNVSVYNTSYKICPHCKEHYDLNREKCPKCDLYLETHRNGNLNSGYNYTKKSSQSSSQQNIPKCPTCGSTNVQLISAMKKATGFVLTGIFSSNFGKSYECKNCKYKW